MPPIITDHKKGMNKVSFEWESPDIANGGKTFVVNI